MIKDRKKPAAVVNRRGGASKSALGTGKLSLPWIRIVQVTISLTILVGLIASAPALRNWINQPIARVEVHATFQNLDQGLVEQQLVDYLQAGFFELDLKGMRETLLAMPWVRKASVRRAWPARLLVSVEEQQAIARWGDSQLISAESEVFAPGDVSEFSTLPILSGPGNQAEEVMQQYLAISQLLRPMGLGLDRLELSDIGSWSFVIGHVHVNMGRDRKMERLQRFIRLYYARLEPKWSQVASVDLRYLNGASVAWSNEVQE